MTSQMRLIKRLLPLPDDTMLNLETSGRASHVIIRVCNKNCSLARMKFHYTNFSLFLILPFCNNAIAILLFVTVTNDIA